MPDGPDLRAVERHLAVRTFAGVWLGADVADQLAAVVREVRFDSGTVVFERGEPCEHIYLLVEGEVRLDAPGQEPWRIGPRSALGVLDAHIERSRERRAVAQGDVRALVVNIEDWRDVLEDNLAGTLHSITLGARDLWRRAVATHSDEVLTARPPTVFPGALEQLAARCRQRDGAPQINAFERLLALRLCPLFERAGMQPLITLARAAEIRALAAGELLFAAGDPVEALFVPLTGEIEVGGPDALLTGRFGPATVVGGFSAFGHDRQPLPARAIDDAVVVVVAREDLPDVMDDHFALVRSVLRFMALERERLQLLWAPGSAAEQASPSSTRDP